MADRQSAELIVRGPFYGVTASAGLHVLKDSWRQKSYIVEQCNELVRTIDEAIAATTRASPSRTREQLRIDHGRPRVPAQEMGRSKRFPGVTRPSDERLLEEAIFSAFVAKAPSSTTKLWSRIVTKQYALFDRRAKGGWGHIDLLGALGDRPVVIELKKASSSEPPLRALIEAASYAIALRKNWPAFSKAFEAAIEVVSSPSDPIPLVVLAPPSYWDRWAERKPWRNSYRALVDALESRGYPARFGSVRAEFVRRQYDAASVQVDEIVFP